MTIGEKIVKLRKQAGYSQEAFSEIMGVSRQAVSKWENGTAQPTAENMAAIAKLFGVPLSYLLDDGDGDINEDAMNLISTAIGDKGEEFEKIRAGIKIFTIAVTVAVRVFMIDNFRMNRKLEQIKNETDYKLEQLESQIDYLIANMNSGRHNPPRETTDFVDSDISVEFYDHNDNSAVLKFSFIPKDYSKNTLAKVGVKSSLENVETTAELKNGMFTAEMSVKCCDDISVYFYLIDGENTRSFSMGMIENPAVQFSIEIKNCEYIGDIKTKNDKIIIDGMLGVDLRYYIDYKNRDRSVYPKKAVLEIYAKDKLIHRIPHTDVMQNSGDYEYHTGESATAPIAVSGENCRYNMYIGEEIRNETGATAGSINFKYIVTDSNGREYSVKPVFAVS